MKRLTTWLLMAIFLACSTVSAQNKKVKSTPEKKEEKKGLNYSLREKGIMQEFRQLEEKIRTKRRSMTTRRQILENNLVRAVGSVIDRLFYPRRFELRDKLTGSNIKYDNPDSPLVYYVKYSAAGKTLLIRLNYIRDPEYYLQSPDNQKILIRDDKKGGKNDNKKGEK